MGKKEKVRKFSMMLENQNIRLLVLLVVLCASVTAAIFFQQDENRVIVDPSIFRVNDLTKIDGVVLESPTGKVKLHYESSGWKVNNRFYADRQLITVLFATLEQTIPKQPVASSQRDSVNARLDASGVSVSIYEGSVLRKQFQAGGGDKNTESWFRLNKNSEAYLMTIPGYRVNVAQIFELDENGWRDKRIFDFSWRNFKSLSATFYSDRNADFGIARKDAFYTIVGMENADTAKVNTYLDDLSLLRADQILSPGFSKRYDSLSKTIPVSSFEITDIANRTYRLSLFQLIKGESLILGRAHENDLVLFNREKFFRAFRKRAYFKQRQPN